MSTMNEREALRRALRLADGIEPNAGGLQRIQARLQPPRPLVVAWAETAWTYARMRVPDDLQRLAEWLRSAVSLVWERYGPKSRASGHRGSRTNGWLRPAAVLGATVFVVAVGTYVAIDAQQALSPSAANALHNGGGGSGPGGAGGAGKASTNAHNPSAIPGYSSRPSASPTCPPAKSGASAPPTPTTVPSSPAASPSSTSTSPSPSPTPSDSPTPAVSPAAQPNLSAVGANGAATMADTIADLFQQTPNSASPAPSPCTTKRPTHRSTGGSTPNPSPLVSHFGKLDDGS